MIMFDISGQPQQVSQRNNLHTIVKERNARWRVIILKHVPATARSVRRDRNREASP
jgi:hypothetical protein